MENITSDPYFKGIILTTIGVLIKLFFGFIFKTEKNYKGILILIYYVLPIVIIVWLNLDNKVENSKLTTTIICVNIAFFIFNYLQMRINEQYEIVSKYGKIEKEKIKEINQINNSQAEKMRGIVNNQNYILNELSKINDRIINYIYENKK
jgi:hypothetical protein